MTDPSQDAAAADAVKAVVAAVVRGRPAVSEPWWAIGTGEGVHETEGRLAVVVDPGSWGWDRQVVLEDLRYRLVGGRPDHPSGMSLEHQAAWNLGVEHSVAYHLA